MSETPNAIAQDEIMSTLIVAVFNHSIARFFRDEEYGGIVEVATMICPEARLPEHDLRSDSASRTQDSFGTSHPYEPRTTAREKLAGEFARKITDWLDSARLDHLYTRLVLVAPPDMLGSARKLLSKQCRNMVVEECNKNLAHMDIATILEVLPYTVKALSSGDSFI